MSKIETNKKYQSVQIIEKEDGWSNFEGFQGSVVEEFLKDKLEDAVVDWRYQNTGFEDPVTGEIKSNILIGLNAFGDQVCYTQVINADPTYSIDFSFSKVTIGVTQYNQDDTYNTIIVNKTDDLSVSTTFNYKLTGNLAGTTYDETSPQSVTFRWFNTMSETDFDNAYPSITRTITPGENITVDITEMFEYAFSNMFLGIQFTTPGSSVVNTYFFNTPFNLKKLTLKYNGGSLIRNNILTNIVLEGTEGEPLDKYRLYYYVDDGSQQYIELKDYQSSNITLTLNNLKEGAHDVYMRVMLTEGNLPSNYIQVSFIYQKETDSELNKAVAMVTEVPDEINNCNLSKFFKVVTTSNLSGDVEVVALKSSTLSSINSINTIEAAKNSDYLFKEVSFSLLNTDPSKAIDYTSYIEVPGNNDSTEYLKILIKDGTGERSTGYFTVVNNNPRLRSYKQISIINLKEGSEHLQYTKGELLNFSQITNGNVFTDLSPNLDESDGLQLEETGDGTLTTFKVSPTEKVFETPKKLLSAGQTALHNSNFSIELMFKTYCVNDLDDKILTIGNITLCPKHLFLNYRPDLNTEPHNIVNASRADFRKEVIQHILITYDPNYKPNTYNTIYDMFYTSGSTTYTNSAQPYPCLKIYVNGTINRVISVNPSTICESPDFNFQIHPSNSNINFYIFRTYDKTLNYEEVKKNYISSISKLVNKQAYYSDNDILYLNTDFSVSDLDSKASILNTISLGKCINKFKSVTYPNKSYKDRKTILVALPEGSLPPYYGNRKESSPKATFLVHYPEVNGVPVNTSGRLSGGKIKAQGSSAKKYMFHNTSYSKFTFTPESQFTSESPITYDYYKMPGSDIEITKLVGKVNTASSMQSHKQGATKLFHDGYINTSENTDWMNGGRKAVLEDEFFYFFTNVPKDDLDNLTWDYFKDESGNYNFEKCYFLGFQTWGSAKGDEATSGYDDTVPHYLMLEGADNDNAAANFKVPWAAMQIWGNYSGSNTWTSADSTIIEQPTTSPTTGKNYYHQFAGGTKQPNSTWTPDYLTGLLVRDETIVYDPGTESNTTSDKRADAWDVNFGITEGEGYNEDNNLFFVFKDKVVESLNRYAQFYNLVYTFDFSSLLYIPDSTTIDGYSLNIDGQTVYHKKLIFGEGCTITYGSNSVRPKQGDIYRWDKAWAQNIVSDSKAQWVPAGLYHNGTTWETLNIVTICENYSKAARGTGTYPAEYEFFYKSEYEDLKAKGADNNYQHILDYYEFVGKEDLQPLQSCMAEAFKIILHEFTDITDVAYHQAFIKLIAGTDNRAKNTYFQIVGPKYTNQYTSDTNGEVDILQITEGEQKGTFGYIHEEVFQVVTIDGETVTETEDIVSTDGLSTKPYYYKKTEVGDFKIHLYQDDLDTIFKTDNNGQQVKPYYLLEPPYNRDLTHLWGDMHSGFFYNVDLVLVDEIKTQLSKLLLFSTDKEWPDANSTKFYEYFLSIQHNLPSISYNHQSEIYYESSQVMWQDGNPTDFYNVFATSGVESWKDFNNNKVYNPVSLSHGSCIEAETEYLRDRVLLLSTYVNDAKNDTGIGIKLNGGSSQTQGKQVTISANYTSFIQYIYPIIADEISSKDTTTLDYDPLLDYIKWDATNLEYQPIDLVYNITKPNEEIDVSVTIQVSGLTTDRYWTNTDMYRTINILQGTESFTNMLNFPNASTVICQDSNYDIVISQNQELKVVDYLGSIEHLVLQQCDINSNSLNFTGCNRLKTLVLGATEDTLRDDEESNEWYAVKFNDVLKDGEFVKVKSSEASRGYNQIILPKSNNVEQVILPNCVKTINISYYPNLTRFEFNDGTQLQNLTIDGRNDNDIIEYILDKFVGSDTTNLEITNVPSDFWLSEQVCRKLANIQNVKIEGTINIGTDKTLAAIDWTTKRLLVEKFGDIVTGVLKFNYQVVDVTSSNISVNATGVISGSGLAPIILTIDGNNIPVVQSDDQHYLNITYTIKTTGGDTPSGIQFPNKYEPYLEIDEGVQGNYEVTTTVYYNNSSNPVKLTTSLTVGFYAPKPGDFAYANGTFNSVYDPSLGLVGIVFYSYTADDITYDVRVLSANYSSTDVPMSYASYAINYQYDTNLKGYQTQYRGFYEALISPDAYTANIRDVKNNRNGEEASGTITYNKLWEDDGSELYEARLQWCDEHTYQKNYISRANTYINKLHSILPSSISYNQIDDNAITNEGKDRFLQVLKEINNLSQITVSNQTYYKTACNGFNYGLFPAFLHALYYEPNVELTGKGKEYFGLGNWYIPDTRELERIIYYRINSCISNSTSTEDHWNSTVASGVDVSQKGLNVFNADAFNNIQFLKDTGSQISSVSGINSDGCSYAYGINHIDQDPIWNIYVSEYYNNISGRDQNRNITPVCKITLTKGS